MRAIKKVIKFVLRKLRRRSSNNLLWTGKELDCPNFGDFIGPYLFRKITGREPKRSMPSNFSLTTTFLAVGSIISWAREDSIIWGSGIVNRGQAFPKPFSVCAVRGPITRQRFLEQGYSCPSIFGDPGLLLPCFYQPKKKDKRYKIGFIPHYVDKKRCAQLVKQNKDILHIDVFKDIECVVDDISLCDWVVSSSLHGLIVAHAYGKKAVWVKFSDELWGDDTKFFDYYGSLGVSSDVSPIWISRPLSEVSEVEELLEARKFVPAKRIVQDLQKGLLNSCPFPSREC